jgi:hypothetical protein
MDDIVLWVDVASLPTGASPTPEKKIKRNKINILVHKKEPCN